MATKKRMIEDALILMQKINDKIEVNNLPLELYDLEKEREKLNNMYTSTISTYQEALLTKLNELKLFKEVSKDEVEKRIKTNNKLLKNKNI